MSHYIEEQPNILALYNYGLDQSEYLIPEELYLNALFFNTAAAMALKNIRVQRTTNRGTKVIIPNFFGISFGEQGIGKDHVRDITESIFKNMFIKFDRLAEQFYDANKGSDADPDRRYLNLNSYFTQVESTEEGIQKTAQTIDAMGTGSVNIVTGEIGDTIGRMDNVFKKLKTGWDTGTSEGATNVADGGRNYFTVKNMCFNALLFGSQTKFEFKLERKEKLIDAYISGMARRSFIYHNDTYKKSENKNRNYESMSREGIIEIEEYIKNIRYFINNTTHIEYPQEVWNALRDYDEDAQVIREKSDSLIASALGAPKKIEKLLGIIATLDLSETITLEHLDFALKFTAAVDATAESTVEIKPPYLQIYNELLKRDFTARTDIVRAIKDVTLSSLESDMILVEEHANMVGNSLIKKENSKIIKYKLEVLTKADISTVILSVNKDPNRFKPEGFMAKNGNFFNIHKIINSEQRYSAGTFKDSYISDENYLEDQNLFIIDVDDGMTIDEAKQLFSNWTFLITTTKSHQIEKNEEICDRFRIILPTISTFHLNPVTYARTYTNVLEALNMPAYDEKCKNASRWYFGNPKGEHWYNEGEMLDIRSFIPDSTEQKAAQQSVTNFENASYNGDISARIEGSIKWFLGNTSQGNRNDNMFRFAIMLKQRVEHDDWENMARHVNTCLSDPLSEPDMNTIIRSVSRK